MNNVEKKAVFLSATLDATNGKDGNFDFTCPLCKGYAIGTRKDAFGSYRATYSGCDSYAAVELNMPQSA